MSLPVVVDPSSKKVSYEDGFLDSLDSESEINEYKEAMDQLNILREALINIPGEIPPLPDSTSAAQNKQINAQIAKMRDAGIQSIKLGKPEATKQLSLAVEMVLKKAPWDSCAVSIEELSSILGPRSDGYIKQNMWPEAFADASLMVLFKGNDAKSHVRKGRCLQQIEDYSEAKKEYRIALALSPGDSSAKRGLEEIEGAEGK